MPLCKRSSPAHVSWPISAQHPGTTHLSWPPSRWPQDPLPGRASQSMGSQEKGADKGGTLRGSGAHSMSCLLPPPSPLSVGIPGSLIPAHGDKLSRWAPAPGLVQFSGRVAELVPKPGHSAPVGALGPLPIQVCTAAALPGAFLPGGAAHGLSGGWPALWWQHQTRGVGSWEPPSQRFLSPHPRLVRECRVSLVDQWGN